MQFVIKPSGDGKWSWEYQDYQRVVKERSGVEHDSKEACLAMVKELKSYCAIKDAEGELL